MQIVGGHVVMRVDDFKRLQRQADKAAKATATATALRKQLRDTRRDLERARFRLRRLSKQAGNTVDDKRQRGEGSGLPDPGGLT